MAHVRQQIVEAITQKLAEEFGAENVHGLTYFEQPPPKTVDLYVSYGEETVEDTVLEPGDTFTYGRLLEILITIVQPINRKMNPFVNEDAQVRVEKLLGDDPFLGGVLKLPLKLIGTEVDTMTGESRLLGNIIHYAVEYNTSAVDPETNSF